MLRHLDRVLQKMVGLPYLFATFDRDTHCRCRYLLHQLKALDGEGLSVLDVGCGAGVALHHLATLETGRIGRYVGLDRQAEHLNRRSRRVQGINVTFHNVDLEDDWDVGVFDVVWCSEVIEHLNDDVGQMQKLLRAARPGGLVMMTTPGLIFRRSVDRRNAPRQASEARHHGGALRPGDLIDDMERLAARTGLIVESIDGVIRVTPDAFKKRDKVQGPARIINNIKMNWRAQGRQDFASGRRFRAEPEHYMSVGAILRRPVDPIMIRPNPKAIASRKLKRDRVSQDRATMAVF